MENLNYPYKNKQSKTDKKIYVIRREMFYHACTSLLIN